MPPASCAVKQSHLNPAANGDSNPTLSNPMRRASGRPQP
nr:MAG TPA: hypothetical protein [Caudoviricetes sp.]